MSGASNLERLLAPRRLIHRVASTFGRARCIPRSPEARGYTDCNRIANYSTLWRFILGKMQLTGIHRRPFAFYPGYQSSRLIPLFTFSATPRQGLGEEVAQV
jgi:hypothetical protein